MLFRFLWSCILMMCISTGVNAQDGQVIRGTVLDADTRVSLPGATVTLWHDTLMIAGSTTDAAGRFRFTAIKPGKYSIAVSYIGYREYSQQGLVVSSGREVVLSIELMPSFNEIQAVEITDSQRDRGDEMALVSNRSFIVEETERYAGSRGDPARMASNFAGVQGTDDSRNDIVVRGNSPAGVLYRLEGIDIPNPNHFSVAGTMGGPVSIINNKTLANSEFYMGAFPSQYGNATAAVFDLKLRSGNDEKHEFVGQFGFLGTELTLEGPLDSSHRTSYLANFRYSTLQLFKEINFQIGTEAVPFYMDGAFKIHHRTNAGSFEVFGIGGKSSIDIVISEIENPAEEIYGDKNRDQYFGTGMGVAGLALNRTIGDNQFLKLVAAVSASESHTRHDLVTWTNSGQVDSLIPMLGYQLTETNAHLNALYTLRSGSRTVWRAGLLNTLMQVNYSDTLLNLQNRSFTTRLNAEDVTVLFQSYLQWKHSLTEKLEITAGLHGIYFLLNQSANLEPRISARLSLNRKHTLAIGTGLHSRLLPLYIYYHQDTSGIQHNRNVGLTKAAHGIFAHEYTPSASFRFRTEVYGQYLYDVPVEKSLSAFSLVNQGTGFTRLFPSELVNSGEAVNYGVEFTVERSFSKTFFLLGTLSLYESKYRGSDMIWRNTDYNGNYIFNVLAGKEFKVGKQNTLQFGIKNTLAGGKRYGGIDTTASRLALETIYIDSLTNSQQFRRYLRTDIKVLYRINGKKVSHEIGLDLVNVFNVRNILALSYIPDPSDPTADAVREEYQLGFLPLFYYRIDI